ncbi:MAG: hypothetical protein EOP61_17090 [Sphingomonadales bacterium]|nr:MAG: hypothetical protein EOP61_17090 [Sphingomonadales bacterium]
MEEIGRYRCTGDDGTPLVVVEYRYIFTTESDVGVRRQRGSAWLSLLNGEPVRYIDAETFEITSSGELLRRN